MKRVATLTLCLGLLAACSDGGPTAVVTPPPPPPLAGRADALVVVDDAIERILPALADGQAAQPLQAALGAVRSGIEQANGTALPGLIAAARQALQAYGAANPEESAELDFVGLALDHAGAQLAVAH